MNRQRVNTPPEIPIARRLADTRQRSANHHTRSPGVLVVDDEQHVREIVVRVLQGLGFAVYEASGASEALRIWNLEADRIGLVITDVQMPGMTGPQLAANLADAGANVELLLMSGALFAPELEREAWFLPKPFTPDELTAKIRYAIESGSGWRHRSALHP